MVPVSMHAEFIAALVTLQGGWGELNEWGVFPRSTAGRQALIEADDYEREGGSYRIPAHYWAIVKELVWGLK